MTNLNNVFKIEGKEKIQHYKKILTKQIFNTLSDSEKEMYINQIDSVEKDLEHKNTVKIRVRPWIIKLLCKMASVHDIRAGAYRGDTVYVGNTQDLFNTQLLQHESIHIAQQKELGGFIKWLRKTFKDMKTYKENYGDSPYIKYESSTLTPMELEAYAHQADHGYLKSRESFAYKKYETPEGEQEAFKKIGNRNDQEIKEQLLQKNGSDLEKDLKKLEDVISKTNDTEWTMRVFNSVDKGLELESFVNLLKEKLSLLKQGTYLNTIQKSFKEKLDKHNREISKNNLNYLFDTEFTDEEEITKSISKLSKDIDNYKKEPTRFWLEPKKNNNEGSIQVSISN